MGFGQGMFNLNPAAALRAGNYAEAIGIQAIAAGLRPEFRTRGRTLVVIANADEASYSEFNPYASFDDGLSWLAVLDMQGTTVEAIRGATGGQAVLGADYPLLKIEAQGGDEASSFKVLIV